MNIYKMAAVMALTTGYGAFDRRERFSDDPDNYDPPRRVIFAQPRLANFTSERPLTKRQRRRLRGKPRP